MWKPTRRCVNPSAGRRRTTVESVAAISTWTVDGMSGKSPDRLARFSVFATLGILGTTQELAQVSVRGMAGADPEVVAEETLSLVSVTTARAAEVGRSEERRVGKGWRASGAPGPGRE